MKWRRDNPFPSKQEGTASAAFVDFGIAPEVDKLVIDGLAPLAAVANGRYPVLMPAITKKGEYQGFFRPRIMDQSEDAMANLPAGWLVRG